MKAPRDFTFTEEEDAVALMRRLGCKRRVTRQKEGAETPRLPILLLPPPGFHFTPGGHGIALAGWWDVTNHLLLSRIVPCDGSCRIVK